MQMSGGNGSMNQNDKDRFLKAFTYLCEVFGKEYNKIVLGAYFNSMSKFTIDEVEKAISNSISCSKFFPKPVELIEMITGGPKGIEDKAETQALKVIEAVKRYGSYQTVKFADETTQRIVSKQFGWGALCAMKEKNYSFFIKDFKSAYLSTERCEGNKLMIDAPDDVLKLTEDIG